MITETNFLGRRDLSNRKIDPIESFPIHTGMSGNHRSIGSTGWLRYLGLWLDLDVIIRFKELIASIFSDMRQVAYEEVIRSESLEVQEPTILVRESYIKLRRTLEKKNSIADDQSFDGPPNWTWNARFNRLPVSKRPVVHSTIACTIPVFQEAAALAVSTSLSGAWVDSNSSPRQKSAFCAAIEPVWNRISQEKFRDYSFEVM